MECVGTHITGSLTQLGMKRTPCAPPWVLEQRRTDAQQPIRGAHEATKA